MAGLLSTPPTNQRPCVPNSGLPSPNMRPNPSTRNAVDDTENTMKFLARMVTVFLARQNPDSTPAKPRPMKNTRNAVTSTHTVSTATLASASLELRSLIGSAGASAGLASVGAAGGAGAWATAVAAPTASASTTMSEANRSVVMV